MTKPARWIWGLFLAVACMLAPGAVAHEARIVHIYNWSKNIDPDVLKLFEEETGIAVSYDVFEGEETLEAKLLTGGSGYDVVFPTMTPFFNRQKNIGLYLKLDHRKLPNLKKLDPIVKALVEPVDPGLDYGVPYLWGTVGIGVNVTRVKQILGYMPKDPRDLVFDPATVEALSEAGVGLFDTPAEVMEMLSVYLGINPNALREEDLHRIAEHLARLRPFVRLTTSGELARGLVFGQFCVVQAWSGDVLSNIAFARKSGLLPGVEVRYIIPKGGAFWSEMMAIPVDAPHPDEAHEFINFILRPDITARITNYTKFANANLASKAYISPDIVKNPLIYPPKQVLDTLYVIYENIPMSLERLRTRLWMITMSR